ncbi:type VII secretion target [Williamsia sp. SKLECPSW1]
MSTFSAEPDAIRAFGATAAGIGTAIESASAMNLGANVAVMVPIFGLIGQDFLGSFAVSQFSNVAAATSLAAVHAGTAASAAAAANEYEGLESDTSAALHSASSTL